MQIENWEKVSDLFDEALDLPIESREAFVVSKAKTPTIAEQVLRLLRAAEHETGFLATSEDGFIRDSDPLPEGTRLGNWQIDYLIGSGGMGEVYLARRADGLYEQSAALKLIASTNPRVWARFSKERQVLANLEHPWIGRLIDGGIAGDQRPFLVMEHVEGQPINDFIARHHYTLRETLILFMKVLEAVSHAHGRLVLHRDIKPRNILVSDDGQPHLIDFGVAALMTEDGDDLNAPMTLRYAAPEQLSGKAASVATDIFGLGATLFELLSGSHPVREGSHLIIENDGLPKALLAILRKSMADEQKDRYGSAEAFRVDIANYLDRRPVDALPPQPFYRVGLFVQRNKIVATAISVVFLALSLGLGGTVWQANLARNERDVAVAQRDRLEAMQQAAFLLLAETSERQGDETTQDIVARSAERILREFQTNPSDAAPTLHMYGELFYLMNDYPAAEPLLRAVADMDANKIGEDLKARAQHDLANVLLRTGNSEEARIYLDKSSRFFTAHPEKYIDEILDLAFPESQLLNEEGKTSEALALLEEILPQRLAYSGRDTMDTAQLYTNLGVARMRTGDMPGAIEASENARDIFIAIGRLESPDGLNAMNNLASLYHITGQTDLAESAYEETLKLRQTLFGNSAATAVLMSNYAKLKLGLGDAEGALTLLDEAVPMADNYAGPLSPPALAARFGKIEALILTGDFLGAETMLVETEARIQDKSMWQTPFGGMQYLYSGQLRAALGKRDAALKDLEIAKQTFKTLGPSAARYLAKVEALIETHR